MAGAVIWIFVLLANSKNSSASRVRLAIEPHGNIMNVQAAASHSLLWYIILLSVLVAALVAMLSRSAADVPPTVSVEIPTSTVPAPK